MALGILGEPAPDRVLGRDIWPQALGQGGAPEWVVSAFCFHSCIRTAQWSYTRPWLDMSAEEVARWGLYGAIGAGEELYDLAADPQELANVAGAHPDVTADLARRLDEHIRHFTPLTTGTIQGTAPVGGRMTFDGLPGLDE